MAGRRPDYGLELRAGAGTGVLVCGVDEVGRGPLAGPVVAAAVILPTSGLPAALAGAIDDSKKLKRAARERLAPEIEAHALALAVASASVAEIDRINILQAALLAMSRAVHALTPAPGHVLVDGRHLPKDLPCPGTAVVGGDGLCLSIAAASILAKVFRDREMDKLSEEFPEYGWARNAGYPTPDHLAALRRWGVSPHHRATFAPVREELSIRR